ncbi:MULTISPECIES: UvrD-helicase domain-containing protein [unclassified Chelatococcus]|uniref:UvrD-helicase domain-containing protein n=1 Tax=unclassified Chelatococcus TaxID=2638111 RepID=UPI001BCF94EF|nr:MULTISPECIES: UvrD-helicase domain-containing protein [unclassified Chelatococcus]CAH1658902.1 ATP-dependent DNA helicase UvrD/PcrA [Hyphomicrobiales bacterium]MBS7740863.1 UvrD-helicase domain-containing protein [Chelatococcus sp. HY11]MBX3545903.1 UvrD-helicase domain-containing protein [Chelatococcus sp.]MCO5079528.1 UvrD-helicase domain-containing protein [Chelatococcus sp.]CAH1683996.1 ATP-dependent DNA helicase UvrD/PcrA [Hyphomicrobiales bacterium]
MIFHADLHIHSKYSRATSRDLDLEHLFWWAARKGIRVVGTGDCVHPAWLAEIKDKLQPEGNGLFRLKPEIEAALYETLPPVCRQPVSFMLCTEISTIYKKGEKTRKVHHLIYAADLDSADRLAARLARIGNIASDGRPILGLDSRDLLEVTLESGPDSYLVPAHIWTPWFAAMGSQSGFDSIDECYRDLSQHIFAVETGLSSDPAMNWRISSLDRFRLTSNSDAHSPGKLGREATRFACAPDYFAIRGALETGEGYVGTVEFFPEEGKYHMDGHRACGVRLDPKETIGLGGRCPVCGRPVTVGVAHRVEALADREEGAVTPATAGKASSLVPLPEILSEIVGSGVASKKVVGAYDGVIAALGAELSVLDELPAEDVARVHPLLGEAVTRLRAGKVIRNAGYDGEYGVIKLFEEGEIDTIAGNRALFDDAPLQRRNRPRKASAATPPAAGSTAPDLPIPEAASTAGSGEAGVLAGLDPDQTCAARAISGLLIVLAGPGSGKTRMLTRRLAHLVLERDVPAVSCLAITFTRKATEELRARLAALLAEASRAIAVHSFHSLGLAILRAHADRAGFSADLRVATDKEWQEALAGAMGISDAKATRLRKLVSVRKRGEAADPRADASGQGEEAQARAVLERIGRERDWVDFDDLVALSADLLERHDDIASQWRARYRHIVADEFQDADAQQYRLLRLIAGENGNLCVIGDPDQAIYSFRGADAGCFARFLYDFPSARTLRLGRNYRSSGTIVKAATGFIGAPDASIMRPAGTKITVHVAPDETAEAEFVAATIEALMGGHDMLAANRNGGGGAAGSNALGFGDCAVLYRTDAQSAALRLAFDRAGIPFAKSSPAPIAGHPGVQAILAALDGVEGDMPQRVADAAEIVRREGTVDAATLAEAKGWLATLAPSDAVVDETARFAEAVALSTEADFHDARAGRVSLLTMHAAKGLEFSVVFIVGLEAGLVPFSWGTSSVEDEPATAEERRLFYVAMTRAKDQLFLSRATERFWRGAVRSLPSSPFLNEIAPDLMTRAGKGGKKRQTARQLSLF